MSYFENGSDSDNSINDSDNESVSDNEIVMTKDKSKKIITKLDDDENPILSDEESIPEEDDEDNENADDIDIGKGAEDDDDEEEDYEEEEEVDENLDDENQPVEKERKKKIVIPSTNIGKKGQLPSAADLQLSDNDDDDDEEGELYLKKFDKEINDNYLLNFHPECTLHNYDEVLAMTKVIRDKNGIIVDDLHKTLPYLTKYERARVLGQRAKQINSGTTAFVKVPENIIDGYLIAELELKEKRIPFIIRRPLPNGGSEYWSIKDLENIIF